jgi:hypothetical protein
MFNDEFLTELLKFASLPIILPIIISFIRFRSLSTETKILCFYIYFSATIEIAANVFISFHIPNLALLHLFTIVEFIFISCLYKKALEGLIPNKIFTVFIVVLSLFLVCNSIFIQPLSGFNTIARTVSNVIIIVYSILFFYKTFKELKIFHLEKEPMFWINSGILFYFSCNLFFFIFSNYILTLSTSVNLKVWFVHAVFNFLIYIFFSIGIWHSPKKKV